MTIINKDEFLSSKRKYLKKMKESVFIYPTDSIYGLGCDATNDSLVSVVRKLKKSNIQPFSIIAPSKEWVLENCVVSKAQKKYFDALGSKVKINGEVHCFTLILKLKNKNAVAPSVLRGVNTIGIRIPDNWFSKIVTDFDKPIVSTSANCTGEDFMTTIDDLNSTIKKNVDFIIYEGEKKSTPSTIIKFDSKDINVVNIISNR